jgi:hypothetical protein
MEWKFVENIIKVCLNWCQGRLSEKVTVELNSEGMTWSLSGEKG